MKQDEWGETGRLLVHKRCYYVLPSGCGREMLAQHPTLGTECPM